MKIVVRKTRSTRVLRWVQSGLFASAALMLGYCGFAVADTWMFQHRATESFELLRAPEAAAPVLSGVPSGVSSSVPSDVPPSVPSGPAAGSDGLIGRMAIQRLGVSVVVVEGTSNHLLRRAVGHIMGTALPGQSGNVGIAGHRDTFFRPLRNIQRDDIITIATVHAEYRYRVVSIAVVKPDNLTVLNSAGNETLTLVTCYPFYFVGYAPDRFIVRAERVI